MDWTEWGKRDSFSFVKTQQQQRGKRAKAQVNKQEQSMRSLCTTYLCSFVHLFFCPFSTVIFWVVLLLCFICFNWMRALHLPFNYNKGTNKEHKTNQLFTFIIFLPFLFGLFTMDEGRRKREISQRKRERRNERKWLVCSFFSFTCSIPFLFFCFGSFRASITKEQSKRNKRNEKKGTTHDVCALV